MIARSGERLRELARDIPGTHAFAADVTDTHQMGEVLGRITRELGAPEVVIHNAVGGAFGNFQEIDPAVLERNFQVNVMALLHLVRRTAPAMIEAGAAPSSSRATPRRCAARRILPASRRPRPPSAC